MTRTERLLAITELQSLLSEYWHDVDTNWGRNAPEYYTEDQKHLAIERTLLKRAGSAKDIVSAVVFLIENDYVTGEVLHVDGGRHIM